LLLYSSTGYQIFKHGFPISKYIRACRHVKIGPVADRKQIMHQHSCHNFFGQGRVEDDPEIFFSSGLLHGDVYLGSGRKF